MRSTSPPRPCVYVCRNKPPSLSHDAARDQKEGGGAVRSTPPPRPCVYASRTAAVLLTRRGKKGGRRGCAKHEARPRRARASTRVETSRRLADAAQRIRGRR